MSQVLKLHKALRLKILPFYDQWWPPFVGSTFIILSVMESTTCPRQGKQYLPCEKTDAAMNKSQLANKVSWSGTTFLKRDGELNTVATCVSIYENLSSRYWIDV